ncbi:isoprenyl transferase [Demequina sp. SYSU T00192]|uniref:Isoprenyl transferase n=1 Tax=Demequina litoralis TaxID=3051660 RepID=A0ABT8G8Z5_9MICO|nr:isoprenyl transferase [Demequina sp. SYSU T00192]MDN4475616.1 isoprenyl transferase [Demequina sp. SYSU T00192]
MGLSSLLYGTYEKRLARTLKRTGKPPRHIGVILDGNRRWARQTGASASHGHQRGADKITEVLEWSQDAGVEVVTLWMLSTDNLQRDPQELAPLLEIIATAVEHLADDGRWRLRHVGDASLLPPETAGRISAAVERTMDAPGLHVNVAVGYGGRHEIAEAVRSFLRAGVDAGHSLEEVAEDFSVEHIADHLYTKGQPDPDLVIRTSGEQRLGGFLLWQSAHSEFYFCEAYWPDFRRIDFLRALRDFSQRERRLGR